ncbi:MAG: hypothetical protein RL065_1790 [Bacteroidota bacterium]|jgi:hypothetical protein
MKQNKNVQLSLFRYYPENLLAIPPLVSSMQSFENALFLLSLKKYASALVLCVSSIESAFKSFLEIEKKEIVYLSELYQRAIERKKNFTQFKELEITKMSKVRNAIIHFGISPDDNKLAAYHLINTAIPLLDECYSSFFKMSLFGTKSIPTSLIVEFGEHLTVAKATFNKERSEKTASYCFNSLIHLTKNYIQTEFLSELQSRILDEGSYKNPLQFESSISIRENINKVLGDVVKIECPVCLGTDELLCKINLADFKKKSLSVETCYCINCSFILKVDEVHLTAVLLNEKLKAIEVSTLDDYGIQ